MLRHLRYFVAVSETCNLARAADTMFASPSSLTRQIRQLELRLGVTLFERNTSGVELTDAGTELLKHVMPMLDRLDASIEETLRIARGDAGMVRIGFHTGAALELTVPILACFRAEHPEIKIDPVEAVGPDMSAGVRDGFADVGIVRMPIETSSLESETLFVDPVVALLSTGHELSERTEISLHEVMSEPVVEWITSDRGWTDFWTMRHERSGSHVRIGGDAKTYHEVLELVANGRAIAFSGAGMARYYPRPDICSVLVSDVGGSRVALVWRADNEEPAVSHFVEIAKKTRDRERSVVRSLEAGVDPPSLERGALPISRRLMHGN